MTDTTTKPFVLIVDDNPKNLQVLGSLLTQNDYTAIAAQSGAQALEYLKSKLPEVILLDIMMPGMDGIEVCQRIKAESTTKDIPILFITALSDIADKTKAFIAGGADYITKPFVKEEVLARIKVHLENSRYLKQVMEANNNLKELNELKDRFLGIAAHDIRSPLGGITGMVEFMLSDEQGGLNDEQREMLQLIFETGNQMMNLVTDLLDVSVIESGNLTLNLSKRAISPLIQDRIRLQQISVKSKAITINTALNDDPEVNIDADRFGQVLDNLLTNAAKFSPQNSAITVSLDQVDDRVVLKVADEGPGISEEDKNKLFGMYTKLTAKPTSGEKSTGLGLAITKKIVEGHNGKIYVEDQSGKGATFVVELPV